MRTIMYLQLCYVLGFISNSIIAQSITVSMTSVINTTTRASKNSLLTTKNNRATSTLTTDAYSIVAQTNTSDGTISPTMKTPSSTLDDIAQTNARSTPTSSSTTSLNISQNINTTSNNVMNLSTTTAIPKIGVISINVTAVNYHFAFTDVTSELLQSFFACLCGTSYQCRIPLTYRQGSNYIYDTGDVEQSGPGSSNENFICRVDDLLLTQYTTALNCSRGQSSCDNCGHFNFTSSQCSGRSRQVKWVSTQSVTLGYNPNIVNIVCNSSKVQCVQRNDFTITTPTATSGTFLKTNITSTTHITENAVKTIITEAPVNIALAVVVACLSLVIVILLIVLFFARRKLNLNQQESELRNSVSRIMSSDNSTIQNAETYSSIQYSSSISTSTYYVPKQSSELTAKTYSSTEYIVNPSGPTYSALDSELMGEENHYLHVTSDQPEVIN